MKNITTQELVAFFEDAGFHLTQKQCLNLDISSYVARNAIKIAKEKGLPSFAQYKKQYIREVEIAADALQGNLLGTLDQWDQLS